MAVMVVNRSDLFPVGTTVKAYPLVGVEPTQGVRRTGEPTGALAATAVVDAAGKLELTGLAENVRYVLWANVGGEDRYLQSGIYPPVVGAWEPLALSGKVKQRAAREPHGARREGERASLRGQLEATAEVVAGETIATVPAGLRPSAQVEVLRAVAGAATLIVIATTGVITAPNGAITIGQALKLDDLSYPLS